MDRTEPTASRASGLERTSGSAGLEPCSGRDPWLDNTRLVAAVLIVVMHVAGPAMASSGALYELWFASWPLRVPLFALVAGYFSSAEPLRGRRAVSLLRNVLGVYVAADLLATLLEWLTGRGFSYTPVHPPFALWFLLALFWWRSLLPLLAHVKHLGVLAVVGSLGAGFVESIGHGYSASRALAFFPLFLLGWYLRRVRARELVERAWVRAAGWAVLAGVLGVGVLLGPEISRRAFAMRSSYPGEGFLEQLPYAGVRAALLVFGVAGALALLAVVPRRRLPWVTYLGQGGMYIYVLHALVILGTDFRASAWYARIDSVPEMLALMAAAVVGACLLASPPVRWATRWLVQPRYTWPYREEPPGVREASSSGPEKDREQLA